VGAAYHITEEGERLFCEKLKAIFLVERKAVKEDSLVMGLHNKSLPYSDNISQWLEIWDYRGDIRFRGFVGGTGCYKSMFVFFEPSVVGKDLKPGLMALLELAESSAIDCAKLVVCLSRKIDAHDTTLIARDLGWVGFELTTLEPWSGRVDEISEAWLMMSMEV